MISFDSYSGESHGRLFGESGRSGLNVVVQIIAKVFKTGRKHADDFKKTMTIQFDRHLPNWNYTAIPNATRQRARANRANSTGTSRFRSRSGRPATDWESRTRWRTHARAFLASVCLRQPRSKTWRTAFPTSPIATVSLSPLARFLIWQVPSANSSSPAMMATLKPRRSAYLSCCPSRLASG
jgi:hypothetical protein